MHKKQQGKDETLCAYVFDMCGGTKTKDVIVVFVPNRVRKENVRSSPVQFSALFFLFAFCLSFILVKGGNHLLAVNVVDCCCGWVNG